MSFFSSLERKLDELDHRSDAEWARKHPHIARLSQSVSKKLDEIDSRSDDEWVRKHPHSVGLVASVGRKIDQLDAPKAQGSNNRTVRLQSQPAARTVLSRPATRTVQSKPVVLGTSQNSGGYNHHRGHDASDFGLGSSNNNNQDSSTFNNDSTGYNYSSQADVTQSSSSQFDNTNYQPDNSQSTASQLPDDSTHQYYLDRQNASVDATQQSRYDSNQQDTLASQDAWNQVQAADTYNSYQTDPSQYMSGGYSAYDTSAISNSTTLYDYSSYNNYNNY